MSETNVDKSEEPSIMSTDPKERILARRLRIQRRLEAMKKDDKADGESTDEQKTKTERQIDASEELMHKLIAEGDEVISNVRVANDAREISRRDEDSAIRQFLLKKLEEEADDSLIKYKEIDAEWPELLESKDPLDIHSGIQSQKAKCDGVLAQKDVIIDELKKAIDNADNKFAEDQKKQNEDIDLLIDRIETQINLIYKAYRREMVLIEDTLTNERSMILENITKKWDSLYKECRNNELKGVERRKEIMREYEQEMNRALIEHQEQYRAQKIWLENECQKLQQEVENMKTKCLMNLEKLNYSYDILKKRESENVIVKNQQRRRINKLQDIVNDLKKNYAELEIHTRVKIEKLMDQVNKAKKNITDLEVKSNHFTTINDKQFMQIWEMNTKNADKLLEQIFKVDKIVYEQMLGLEWEQPDESLLKIEDLPSYKEAVNRINRIKIANDDDDTESQLCKSQTTHKLPEKKLLMKDIMIKVADQAEFLIEDKILALISQYSYENQVIVKLDHIFQVLNITSKDEVYTLIDLLLPHLYCPTCQEEEEEEGEEGGEDKKKVAKAFEKTPDQKDIECDQDIICPSNSPEFDEKAERLRQEVLKFLSLYFKKAGEADDEEKDEEDEEKSAQRLFDTSRDDLQACNLKCDKGHALEIQSASVIKILSEFMEKNNRVTRDSEISENLEEKVADSRVVLSRGISEKDIQEYWKRYREIFSSKREQLWDALMIGLQKYHEILKERHKLISETEALQKQNAELRRLLDTCGVKPRTGSTQRKSKSAPIM